MLKLKVEFFFNTFLFPILFLPGVENVDRAVGNLFFYPWCKPLI